MQPPVRGSCLKQEDLFALHYNKVQGTHIMPSDDFHEHYEIYYLVSGQRDYFINENVYPIQKGGLVLIPPYVPHRTIDIGAPAYERFLAHFRESFLSPLGDLSPDLLRPFRCGIYHLPLDVKEQRLVESLLQKMLAEIREKKRGYELYLKALMIELLLVVNRVADNYIDVEEPTVNVFQQRVSDIAGYINDYYFLKTLSLSTLSERFCLSPGYISSLFKEMSGLTFTEYLNTVRIREAQKRLRETKDKVRHIASQVGFENVSHYGRVFKQVSGMSPLQYRYLYRKKGTAEQLSVTPHERPPAPAAHRAEVKS